MMADSLAITPPVLMDETKTILLVDDSEDDLFLLGRAFKGADLKNPVRKLYNGLEAIAYLKGDGLYADRGQFALPGLVLLDLNMPKKNGFDVLSWAQARPSIKHIPIFVMTSSVRSEDVEKAYGLGAKAYLVKPTSLTMLTDLVRAMKTWLVYNHLPSA